MTNPIRRVRHIDGPELARIRQAYEDTTITTHDICRRFRIARDGLTALARHHEWKMRRPVGDPKAEERIDKLTDGLAKIDQWCKAYPEKVFRPISPDKMKEAAKALRVIDVDMGAMHAEWARHLISGIGNIARAALAETETS